MDNSKVKILDMDKLNTNTQVLEGADLKICQVVFSVSEILLLFSIVYENHMNSL
jgi:hypothetical protein